MQWPIPQYPTKAVVGSNVVLGSSATANVKGNWTTYLSDLPAAASWINIGPQGISSISGNRGVLVDLAVGSAGSETLVVENLLMGFRTYRSLAFPLYLPAGSTLRGRMACEQSGGMWGRATAFCGEPDSGLTTPGRIVTYGAVPASSGGTPVTPGTSSGVMGSYATLAASTSAPIHALMVLVQPSSSTVADTREYLIDIAVGAPGSETVIVPMWQAAYNADFVHPRSPEFLPLSVCLPGGVRLAARAAANVSSAPAIEVAVYGFTF